MTTFIHEPVEVRVPGWVVDLESFRRWADADDFPEKGRLTGDAGQARGIPPVGISAPAGPGATRHRNRAPAAR
jgi:hypothetical protein